MNIYLAKYNKDRYLAAVEDDDELERVDLVISSTSAQDTCVLAAAKLRGLADRFDKLAKEPELLKSATQARLNAQAGRPDSAPLDLVKLLARLMGNMRSTRGDIRHAVVMRMFDVDKDEAVRICEQFGYAPFEALPLFDNNQETDNER